MKKGKQFISIFVFLVFLSSMALANGLNLNGLGSKAIAMGGAFVGLADDYSAIFWNPAGIAQFNMKTFAVSVDDVIPKGTYSLPDGLNPFTMSPFTIDTETVSKHYLTGLVAYYHPVGENLVVGFGAYTPSGLGAEWDGSAFAPIALGGSYDWKSKIGVVTISPAIAYRVSDQFFVGATFNINYGMFDIQTHAGGETVVHPLLGVLVWDFGQQHMDLSGWGYGATFGLLFTSDYFNFGATYRTPSKIKFSGTGTISDFNLLGTIPPPNPFYGATIPTSSEVDGEVTWPYWLCAGVAFKPMDGFTLTADVQYTHWKEIDVVEFEFTDPIWALITAATGGNEMPMHWRSQTQIRFGAEYKLNGLALRGGYYWDPSPAPDETMNVLVPNYDFSSFSFGIGYAQNGLVIDVAIEYLTGKERSIPFAATQDWHPLYDPEFAEAMPGVYGMKIWAPSITIGYSF